MEEFLRTEEQTKDETLTAMNVAGRKIIVSIEMARICCESAWVDVAI